MVTNFPNLVKEINIQVDKAQIIQNKMKPKRPPPRHNIIKMPKVKNKEVILKVAKDLNRYFSKEKVQMA